MMNDTVLLIVCLAIAVACFSWLWRIVLEFVSGREEYNTPIPFVVGGILALLIGIWPPAKLLAGWKMHVARALVFTICLAPLPFGPEGTLVPSGFSALAPILLTVYPHGVVLTFISTVCLSIAAGRTRSHIHK